jgi:hypothetical protein
MLRFVISGAVVCTAVLAIVPAKPHAQAPPFDLSSGNIGIEVIIPAVIPALFQTTTPNDAPIILRHTTLITNAWFDAIAPYHPTAKGVYSRMRNRPASEATTGNKNIAMAYATYRLLNRLMPRFAANWRQMLLSVGLNPDDASTDASTPIGIGNVAGNAVAAARERDGMNQLGDEGGRVYDRRPYADYTGYTPVNTSWKLWSPSRWQPLFTTSGNGTFLGQQFATPQWGLTTPYSYRNAAAFRTPPPVDSHHHRRHAYEAQANEVMTAQANLTDYQKMAAEHFDNKISGLGFAALFIAQSRGMSLDEFVHYDFLTNMAAFDGGITTWRDKYSYDAVRPVTAIHHLHRGKTVTGWAGPGRGVVADLPADEWRSYLNTANHPEYPSGSACFCAAHAQASRRYLGSDALGWSVRVTAGSSVIEPGVTPATDIVLGPWDTFSDFEEECGLSRIWGGVHFRPAVEQARAACRQVGDKAFEFLQRKLNGQ